MSSLGGCTLKEEIYWRMENTLIVSLLMDGWFRESSPLANKKSIIIGSPGVGKSTIFVRDGFPSRFQAQEECAGVPTIAQISSEELSLLFELRRWQGCSVCSEGMRRPDCDRHI
ncbi:unnamed protein product [Peronospora effusa]|nr:unnamed protein product [Peronospora effusa]